MADRAEVPLGFLDLYGALHARGGGAGHAERGYVEAFRWAIRRAFQAAAPHS